MTNSPDFNDVEMLRLWSGPKKMTHSELVDKAALWLRRRRHPVVVCEIVGGREVPDAMGWRGAHSTLVECKASRADFKRDEKKIFRRYPKEGMGFKRYYMAPEGIIRNGELPEGWGLLEVTVRGAVRVIRQSRRFLKYNWRAEMRIMVSTLRRCGQHAPDAVSISCYTYETQNTAKLICQRQTPVDRLWPETEDE